MTWAKYGGEFWEQIANAGLSDAAARTHAEAIGWLYCVERDDLRVPKRLVRRFAGSESYEVGVKELVAAGFWTDDGDTYRIVHHADVVRASMNAQRRKRERDKQAQRRSRKRVSADVSDDVISDADRQTDSEGEPLPHSGEAAHLRKVWPA